MELIQAILEQNACYKQGKRIRVQGLMLHSVGCAQPSAEVFVRNWNKQQMSVCVHAFIDGNTGKVYQTLPWEYKGWHCGGTGNGTHIGVEMCEPAGICYTGGASFTCTDKQAALEAAKRTYEAAVELFAFLCGQYRLDPLADGVIVSHKEGHARGIASGHADPEHLWMGLHTGYTMDGFRQAVYAAMVNAAPQPAPAGSAAMKGAMPQPEPQETCRGDWDVSDRGVALVAKYEGCRLQAYKCPAGAWTIGYGHTAGVKQGDTLPDEAAARRLLKEDLKKYGGYVVGCIKNGAITFAMTQGRFDALTSFTYNCGSGNLQKLVQGRDAATVAEKILCYNKGGGKVLNGLVKRREEERSMFLNA